MGRTTSTHSRKRPQRKHREANAITRKRLSSLKPSPENDELYRAVDPNDPAIIELPESIDRLGIKERLVVTSDSYMLGAHRRYVAATLAGLDTHKRHDMGGDLRATYADGNDCLDF